MKDLGRICLRGFVGVFTHFFSFRRTVRFGGAIDQFDGMFVKLVCTDMRSVFKGNFWPK